jgi:hypothetical protein
MLMPKSKGDKDMSNIVNIPVASAERETLEWSAAVRIIEAALIEFTEGLSDDDVLALGHAWGRIMRG